MIVKKIISGWWLKVSESLQGFAIRSLWRRKTLADSAHNQEIQSLGIKTNDAISSLELEYELKLLEALEKNKTEQFTLTSV